MSKYGRAQRAAFVRHPDSERVTRRIPFNQLRDMVMALIEADEDDDPAYAESVAAEIAEISEAVREFDDDTNASELVREFEAAPTTYRSDPRHNTYRPQNRLDTVDTLIESLVDR